MRILVSGGCGYIGSVLVNYLLNRGHLVTTLDNLTYTATGLAKNFGKDGFQFINGDIRNADDCRAACRKQDVVIHLAAIVGEPACKKNRQAHDINVFGTRVLYEIADRQKVKTFIFASTCSNYGKAQMATEEAALYPLGLYAKTKVEAEDWLLRQNAPMNTIILRFATAFGLSARMRFDLLVNQLVLDAFEERKLEIYNKAAWRPFCHILDISRAIDVVMNSCPRITDRQVYNVGGFNTTKETMLLELSTIFPKMDCSFVTVDGGRDYSVDFGRINRLGFRAKRHIFLGMIEVADALKLGFFENPRKMNNV